MTVEKSGVLNVFNIRHKNRNYLLHNDDKDDKKKGTNGRKRRLYLRHNAVEFVRL